MSFHQKIVRNCKNPHVGLRYDTSARALHNSHRSCFEPFVPTGKLTEKQQRILDGEDTNPRKGQVTVLLRKLRYYDRIDEANELFKRYEFMYREVHKGDLPADEASKILYELTPDELK